MKTGKRTPCRRNNMNKDIMQRITRRFKKMVNVLAHGNTGIIKTEGKFRLAEV